jgi:hypothetical protein
MKTPRDEALPLPMSISGLQQSEPYEKAYTQYMRHEEAADTTVGCALPVREAQIEMFVMGKPDGQTQNGGLSIASESNHAAVIGFVKRESLEPSRTFSLLSSGILEAKRTSGSGKRVKTFGSPCLEVRHTPRLKGAGSWDRESANDPNHTEDDTPWTKHQSNGAPTNKAHSKHSRTSRKEPNKAEAAIRIQEHGGLKLPSTLPFLPSRTLQSSPEALSSTISSLPAESHRGSLPTGDEPSPAIISFTPYERKNPRPTPGKHSRPRVLEAGHPDPALCVLRNQFKRPPLVFDPSFHSSHHTPPVGHMFPPLPYKYWSGLDPIIRRKSDDRGKSLSRSIERLLVRHDIACRNFAAYREMRSNQRAQLVNMAEKRKAELKAETGFEGKDDAQLVRLTSRIRLFDREENKLTGQNVGTDRHQKLIDGAPQRLEESQTQKCQRHLREYGEEAAENDTRSQGYLTVDDRTFEEIAVPAWFSVIEKGGKYGFFAITYKAKYLEFMSRIQKLERMVEAKNDPNCQGNNEFHYHQPNYFWPSKKQRERGGWWKCRSGLEAPPPERECCICHKDKGIEVSRINGITEDELLQHITDYDEEARHDMTLKNPETELQVFHKAIQQAKVKVAKEESDKLQGGSFRPREQPDDPAYQIKRRAELCMFKNELKQTRRVGKSFPETIRGHEQALRFSDDEDAEGKMNKDKGVWRNAKRYFGY